MKYLMKIKGKYWKAFKEKSKTGIGYSMRLNAWIDHFSGVGFESAIGKELLGSEAGGKYTRSEFNNKYSIFQVNIYDRDSWNKFKEKCAEKNVSANYMLNQMVLYYIANGPFIKLELWA